MSAPVEQEKENRLNDTKSADDQTALAHSHVVDGRSDVGGEPRENEIVLSVPGMTCSNCVRHVGEALREVPGVRGAEVSLEDHTARVRLEGNDRPKISELLRALTEAGYEGKILEAGTKHSHFGGWKLNVVIGLAATIPMMIAEWVFGLGMRNWYQWASFFAAIPVQVICGAQFYKGAWRQARVGQSNMDTLVALGSTTAFLYSVWGLFARWHDHLFFMDSAAIITLVSLGHYFEAKASAQAASSLKSLLQLAPEKARRLFQGREEDVRVSELRAGDRVAIRPGDRVPTDGTVAEGSSSVDESMLTGESMPVEKPGGGKLFAGTINLNGRVVMAVTATGESTALAHIIEVVRQAQTSRANIQRLGDKVSSIFVPIVLLVAIATGLWWGLATEQALALNHFLARFLWSPHFTGGGLAAAIFHSAAVLIIACPCAMGLATPVAIMAGTNVAARKGILITDGSALEKSGTITAILFDKTGTLTQGKVEVAEVLDFESGSSKTLEIASALAKNSTHPLSRAIARKFSTQLNASEWQELRGSGLAGKVDGSATYRLGSLRWLEENGADLKAGKEFTAKWGSQGASVLGLAQDNRLLGLLALRDQLKHNAASVVGQLQSEGLKVYLVSGDRAATANAIAAQVGIPESNVRAEVSPEGKVDVIRELQGRGEHVAFAGDGINDAPALKQVNLGIAIMEASDVARESADIVLLKADLEAIPEALALAKATLRTIKQNLFWAFFYNAAGVPLAALGFVSPIFSALAMGLSDLIVIGNALRLRAWK